MKKSWHALLATGVATALLVGTAGASSAASAGVDPSEPDLTLHLTDEAFSQLTPSAGLVVQQDGGSSVGTLALIFNGCEGFTDNPHRSGPDASVHGRTRCPGVSPVKQQTTALYRIDWWGDNLMNRVTGQAYNKSGTLEVPVHANCGGAPNRGYRGVSNHLADYNGQRGTVTTGNEKWFACN